VGNRREPVIRKKKERTLQKSVSAAKKKPREGKSIIDVLERGRCTLEGRGVSLYDGPPPRLPLERLNPERRERKGNVNGRMKGFSKSPGWGR